jgi:hypothetical protein
MAHFPGHERMDARRTQERILQLKREGILDSRVKTRGPSAEWAVVRVVLARDGHFATVAEWRTAVATGASKGQLPKSWMRDRVELIPRDYQGPFDSRLEKRDGKDWPVCEVVERAETRLRRAFGKTAPITDLPGSELSDRELVQGWRLRWQVEEDFRWLKDRYVMSVKPIWVRHPAAVPGHLFVCVMGPMLLRYLQWKVRDLDLSTEEPVDPLRSIRLGVVQKETGPELVLERVGRSEAELVSRLGLFALVPTPTGIES